MAARESCDSAVLTSYAQPGGRALHHFHFRVWNWRKKDFPQSRWFLRATAVSGVAAVVALECGWIVTEVGRQPWIVYNVMHTADAVTQAKATENPFWAVRMRSCWSPDREYLGRGIGIHSQCEGCLGPV